MKGIDTSTMAYRASTKGYRSGVDGAAATANPYKRKSLRLTWESSRAMGAWHRKQYGVVAYDHPGSQQ